MYGDYMLYFIFYGLQTEMLHFKIMGYTPQRKTTKHDINLMKSRPIMKSNLGVIGKSKKNMHATKSRA